ncbi:uncharacterized protein LOC116007853 [Ipomoea triloba]|uniref:uncharacterized protein LOC116007853 n=1 Tax=Ipomoea triloba TaxID=35885 RepID=UPI00125E8514|nr:uncharacterized protein LOC116007853 [Ipomoea triloba]
MWRLQGKHNLMDIGFGCFIIRFDNRKDYLHVLLDGPWKIFDNYLVIQRWEPEYRPRTARLKKMAVWVRLPELPAEYFRDDLIKLILENVGKPLKLDRTTLVKEKGRFARAAVEVDLNKPLVTEIWVRDSVQMVEYEGLHVVYFGCGVVGHREEACPLTAPKTPVSTNMETSVTPEQDPQGLKQSESPPPTKSPVPKKRKYGTWMLVTKKNKPTKQQKKPQMPTKQKGTPVTFHGNRFGALAEDYTIGEETASTRRKGSAFEVGESSKNKSVYQAKAPQPQNRYSQPQNHHPQPQNRQPQPTAGRSASNAKPRQPPHVQKSSRGGGQVNSRGRA